MKVIIKIQELIGAEAATQKCPKCNWANIYLFKLDGWDKDDWMCGDCFAQELSNFDYEVTPSKKIQC